MADAEIYDLAVRVGRTLERQKRMLATAESCTGGWIAEAITMVPGSSAWFDRGFVTYTNVAKREMLGVRGETIDRHGAVSEEVVREMVTGALRASHAQVALSVSGVAGPSGGTPAKPIGTVCFAWGRKEAPPRAETQHFPGDREAVRRDSVIHALTVLLDILENAPEKAPS